VRCLEVDTKSRISSAAELARLLEAKTQQTDPKER
jgi:hypothetical protein